MNETACSETPRLAWHFVGDTLRDGRPVPPDREWLVHDGPIALCRSGLHASERVIDALAFAPGATLCRVEVRGVVGSTGDKLVARERRILWRFDAAQVLAEFAEWCAAEAARDAATAARGAATARAARGAATARAARAARDATYAAYAYAAREAAREAARRRQNAELERLVRAAGRREDR